MIREISVSQLKKKDEAKDEALEKITEGLKILAQMNIDMSQSFAEAMSNIKHPETIDIEPLIEKINEEKKSDSYIFKMNRNAAGWLTSVEVTPK